MVSMKRADRFALAALLRCAATELELGDIAKMREFVTRFLGEAARVELTETACETVRPVDSLIRSVQRKVRRFLRSE